MHAVIIVAGGTGSRLHTTVPKQLMEIHHKPVIVYSIEKFLAVDKNMVLIISLHKDYFEAFEKIKQQYRLSNIQVVQGGDTRYQSVKNALAVLPEDIRIVAVHDAARPLVSGQTISKAFETAEKFGSAIPVIDANESLREVDTQGSHSVDRTKFKIVQTPQCFKKEWLVDAYNLPYNPLYTDDASVIEKAGHSITLSEGNVENIKITFLQDFQLAELLLQA